MDVVCLLLEHITGVKYLTQNSKGILKTCVESRLDRVREFVPRDGDDKALANNRVELKMVEFLSPHRPNLLLRPPFAIIKKTR